MLTTGTKAPKIKGVEFKGKTTVLYFYPKDDTPGCTANACNFRDNYAMLTEQGFTIIGVSPQDEKSHTKFKEKYDLPFELIADTDKSIAQAYQVWGKKKFMGREYEGILRTTFVINDKGVITTIIDKVDTKNSTEQLLKSIVK
ncbi:MAG TPA: peroxiredoxin [Chitinophagales bacterium]|nr:peroxiredoxin [Chitinophagales bacterium]HNM31668.1 peroxiredoxin [Chitinophagales bacterium]